MPDAWMRAIVKPEHSRKCEEALELLQQLKVLVLERAAGQGSGWSLEPTFRTQLRRSVVDPASLGHGGAVGCDADGLPTGHALNAFAESQWQTLLLVLVEGRAKHLRAASGLPALDARALLRSAGLVDDAGDITALGFRFLFMDAYGQLWQLLQQYLTDAAGREGLALADVLGFLLQLAFRKASQPLQTTALPSGQLTVAAHMAALGLLQPVQHAGGLLLCPTFLASMLCGSSAALAGAPSDVGGFIVVETSFRVYAYTASPVQIAILQLFMRTDCILPNVYVGTLTSRSITAALERGITAHMIVRYLEQHHHPQVAHRTPVVPEAVRDQVMLWESELNRMRCTRAALYDDFDSRDMYERTRERASELGAVLFQDDKVQRLVIDAAAHDRVRDFVRALKLAAA